MKFPLVIAILILFLACALQFWLGSAGIFVNLILAALVAFAFFFGIFEMAVFVLFAVFVVNWQPALSIEMALFVLIPLAAFAFRKFFAWSAWAGIPVMIAGGFLVLYLAVAPHTFATNLSVFVLDLVGSLIFGELVLAALKRAER
ncbi:MAG: hypothetical protein P4L67_00720 [Candidatus Pacebacteria bacterium]|nr:hypothetical protein [Candidatus Paceibacterota bacterium]